MALPVTDTIAAIATAPGAGSIGIIRISGPQAPEILKKLFIPYGAFPHGQAPFETHKLYYGRCVNQQGETLDEVLAVHMHAPSTYTCEDVVEIHSHGSPLALRHILSAVLLAGARPAEPGEFTKRAFLGGRIDLTQAEAVVDLLQAQSKEGLQLAVNQLRGELYEEMEAIRKELVAILAIVEVAIDFPDDDVEIIDGQALLSKVQGSILTPLQDLVRRADRGKVIRDGVDVVIVGQPNVGKSSLLNMLLQEERALVTSLPGTTRDTIEEMITIRGVPVHLVDTAGIRAHEDVVEELGIERAQQKLAAADIVLFVTDLAAGFDERDKELYATVEDKQHLVVLNKKDLASEEQVRCGMERFPQAEAVVALSAGKQQGLDELEHALAGVLLGETGLFEGSACVPNVRHLSILKKTITACKQLEEALQSGISADLLAVEVQIALDLLGDIVGLTSPEDVLDAVFADFCIGK